MSQSRLAETSGVPQPIISRIESDLREPTPQELTHLAAALQFPIEFFWEVDAPKVVSLFRKRAIRSVTTNKAIQARVNAAVIVARRIIDAGVVIQPQLTFPRASYDGNPEATADNLRRMWDLPHGKIDHVTSLIEAGGGIVLHVDMGSDAVSATFVTETDDPRLWFLVNSRETAGDRIRFSLAHELGHALLHHSKPNHDREAQEQEAHQFASELLLPRIPFDSQVNSSMDLTTGRKLKRLYAVSIQAIVKTAKDRGLITKERSTSLYKQLSARGWRTDEPDPIPIEHPSVWPQVLDFHRENHGYDDAKLAEIARVRRSDLADLFPTDFVSVRPEAQVDLAPRIQGSHLRLV